MLSSLYVIQWKGSFIDAPPAPRASLDAAGNSSDDAQSVKTIPRKPLPDDSNTLLPTESAPGADLAPPPSMAALQEQVVGPRRARAATTNSQDVKFQVLPPPQRVDSLGILDYTPPEPSKLANSVQAPPVRKPVGPRAMAMPLPRKPVPGGVEEMVHARDRRDSAASFSHPGGNSRSPSPRKRGLFAPLDAEPFTLEIIRRNLSTGYGQIIGQVSSYQPEDPVSVDDPLNHVMRNVAQEESNTLHPPIDVQLNTRGYSKFRHNAPKDAIDNYVKNEIEYCTFRRQVVMSYSKSSLKKASETFHKFMDKHVHKKGHARQPSDDSIEEEKTILSATHPGKGMKARGYTVPSPWGSNCVFQTTATGRGVRCVRFGKGPGSQADPRDEEHKTDISELRFNLSDPDSEEKHFGRSKMGKLVIYDGGQKMMDLVVAANVGIWWSSYERTLWGKEK